MTDINGRIIVSLTRKLNIVLLILFVIALTGCSEKNKKYSQGVKPEVRISGINTETVMKYEKFEVIPDLKNVKYKNRIFPCQAWKLPRTRPLFNI